MPCPCDQTAWPPPLDIPAGLSDLPRQRFVFAELRRAMLDRAKGQPALAEWRARAPDDWGVMWLELWAYVGELLSLYDKAIADESYVRTAKLRPSLRRLLESLGYVPAPAVAASVELAVLADGVKPVELPVGTGFRSGGFDGEPPQVFELVAPATIHPARNRWPVVTPVAGWILGTIDHLLLSPQDASVGVGDVVLVEIGGAATNAHVRRVTAVDRVVDDAGRRVVKVGFDRALQTGAGAAVADVRVRKATRTVGLKIPERVGGDLPSWGWLLAYFWVLDGQHREVAVGDRFLVSFGGETRWATCTGRSDQPWRITADGSTPAQTIDVKNADGSAVVNKVVVPGQTIAAVTAIFTLLASSDPIDSPSRKASSTSPSWGSVATADGFTIGIGLRGAGTVLGAPLAAVGPSAPLRVTGARPPVNSTAEGDRLILVDAEERGVAVDGTVVLATGAVTLAAGETWSPDLAAPLTAYGNIVTAVRGETVASEVLGSGDATLEHQRFKLAKKPLTYVPAAGAAGGVASTLTVRVDGLAWTEVPSFFGQGPEAQVYVVRQDDDGDSFVTFGDGVRGARVTTGVDNVVASYRHGAGAASPPAGSIAQVARPVPGLARVIGPVGSGGGADAEDAESIRELAPRSALLLGRAISIEDFEVAARATPGVTTARADWTWDGTCQRPVVKVWIVAGPGVDAAVRARLVAISAPDTPIFVAAAAPVTASLGIDLELDPKRIAAQVLAAAEDALLGDRGWLLPASLGIAGPLLRSPLLARLFTIPGVTGVKGLSWNGAPFTGYGVEPGVGAYFELTHDTLVTGS